MSAENNIRPCPWCGESLSIPAHVVKIRCENCGALAGVERSAQRNPGPPLYKGQGRGQTVRGLPAANDLGVIFATADRSTAERYSDFGSGHRGSGGVAEFTFRDGAKIADISNENVGASILQAARKYYEQAEKRNARRLHPGDFSAEELRDPAFIAQAAREIAEHSGGGPGEHSGLGDLGIMDDWYFVQAVKSLGYDGVTDGTNYAFVKRASLMQQGPAVRPNPPVERRREPRNPAAQDHNAAGLRAARLRLGLTEKQMALALVMTYAAYQKREAGESHIPADAWPLIAILEQRKRDHPKTAFAKAKDRKPWDRQSSDGRGHVNFDPKNWTAEDQRIYDQSQDKRLADYLMNPALPAMWGDREDWQVPLEMYLDFRGRDLAAGHPGVRNAALKREIAEYRPKWARAHREAVRAALARGMPVPAVVLRDYWEMRDAVTQGTQLRMLANPPIELYAKALDRFVARLAQETPGSAEHRRTRDELASLLLRAEQDPHIGEGDAAALRRRAGSAAQFSGESASGGVPPRDSGSWQSSPKNWAKAEGDLWSLYLRLFSEAPDRQEFMITAQRIKQWWTEWYEAFPGATVRQANEIVDRTWNDPVIAGAREAWRQKFGGTISSRGDYEPGKEKRKRGSRAHAGEPPRERARAGSEPRREEPMSGNQYRMFNPASSTATCPNCYAAITVAPQARVVRCPACGAESAVERNEQRRNPEDAGEAKARDAYRTFHGGTEPRERSIAMDLNGQTWWRLGVGQSGSEHAKLEYFVPRGSRREDARWVHLAGDTLSGLRPSKLTYYANEAGNALLVLGVKISPESGILG